MNKHELNDDNVPTWAEATFVALAIVIGMSAIVGPGLGIFEALGMGRPDIALVSAIITAVCLGVAYLLWKRAEKLEAKRLNKS